MLKRVIVGIAIALGVAGWGYRAELAQLYTSARRITRPIEARDTARAAP
jgi:hypothetical protein